MRNHIGSQHAFRVRFQRRNNWEGRNSISRAFGRELYAIDERHKSSNV